MSRHVLAKFKYFYVHSLVEYFQVGIRVVYSTYASTRCLIQMETRWSLRRLLIENFMLMASLDPPNIVSLMLSSVLPLELAQDLYQNTENVIRYGV